MKGSTSCGAAHGTKGGSKAAPTSHGPSKPSSSDKEAMGMTKQCGKNK